MKKKIAVVARTIGLEYDDRIRKECISLSKKADIHLFINFTSNLEETGVTTYGIPYQSFKLQTREKLPSGRFLFSKSLEFYFRIAKYLKDYDYIWAHEVYTYLFALLAPKNKCIWDQHEIPAQFEKPILKSVFHYIEKRCRKMIHANDYRIEYLKNKGVIQIPDKHTSIRNFSDKQFLLASDKNEKNPIFDKWLKDQHYIYLQGLTTSGRYPLNTIEAIIKACDLKAIVVGRFDKEAKKQLEIKYLERLNERIFFMGMVDQLKIPAYVCHAMFSIILYDTKKANNRLCEPNRMYQSIIVGVPVIVGCNEPMKYLVEKYNFGICLKSDGSDLSELEIAIKNMQKNLQIYRENINSNRGKIIWDSQELSLFELL